METKDVDSILKPVFGFFKSSFAKVTARFIFFEKPIDTFKHVISKYKSMEISRYEALKNKKYSAENQYRTHIHELGFDFKFDTLCELRTETKKLTYGFMGAGYQYETEFSQNHGKTTSLILFPKLVTLQHYESDLTSLAKFIEEQNYYPNFQNLGSDNDLHTKAEMTDLVRFFKKSVFDFLTQTGQLVEDVQITQCWANKTNFGNSHHRHEHPNSFISGVFYLTSGGGGNIIFHQNEYKTILPILHEQNMFNSNTFQIKPKKGLLVLFQSSYTHSTQVNTAESPRYSIAFNVLPKGQVGHWESAAWANL